MDRKTIRARLRALRRALSTVKRQEAALALARLFCDSPWFNSFQRFAVYMVEDGEIDPALIVKNLWLNKKTCYLPVLSGVEEGRFLKFKSYQPATSLAPNRFGIPEPQGTDGILPAELDVVLTPLVAFDPDGNRLGMGGGYYDRTFGNLGGGDKRPHLIGLAYEFQKLEHLEAEAWDVPLTGIFTEKRFYPRPESRCIP